MLFSTIEGTVRHRKSGLNGPIFAAPDKLRESVRHFLEEKPGDELTLVLEGWVKRIRWVIAMMDSTLAPNGHERI
jgi:hypothetical protein